MRIALIASLCAVVSIAACPPEGDTKLKRMKALNRLKNRTTLPTIYPAISLDKMLQRGQDRDRFNSNSGAMIEGVCIEVKAGGSESCNCRAKDLAQRDTHIVIAKTGLSPDDHSVVVEVSPAFRVTHPEWSTKTLKRKLLHKRVRISGWLFYDAEHVANSLNTATSLRAIWRGTAWEIHPITMIEVLK